MIDDLDKTLERLLRHELPTNLVGEHSISFASPDTEFPPTSVTLPAIDLFLYDVRENTDLRDPGWQMERTSDGRVRKQRAPVRVDCSYLVTAWANDSNDEHRLLGEVMRVLLRHPTIPEAVLQGSLQSQRLPPPTCSIQQSQLQSWGDFWQAIGGKPKAALNYTVTIGVDLHEPIDAGVPVVDTQLGFMDVGDEVTP